MDNAKIMKSARIIDRVLRIVQGFMIASGIVCAVFIPLTLIFGEKIVADADNPSFGALTLQLTGDVCLNTANFKAVLIPNLLLSIALLVLGWYYIRIMRGIFAPLKEGRPFEQGISGRIRTLAWTTLIGGGIYEIGKAAVSVLTLHLYDLSMVFNPEVVSGYTYNFVLDGSFLILSVVLFLLSYVFRCGEALQKESDETL